jgi:hypothetical protein
MIVCGPADDGPLSARNWHQQRKFGVNVMPNDNPPQPRRTGGCQCGEVRYAYTGKLGAPSLCHCRMCQKAFGSFGAVLVDMRLADFSWTRGQPGIFRSSSIVSRGFCRDCGTPLFMHDDDDPHIEIAVGTLDDPMDVPAFRKQSAVESKLPWFNTLHLLPEERMEDYRTPEDMEKLRSLQHPDHDT